MGRVIIRACSALIKPPQHGTGQPKPPAPAFAWPRLPRCLSSLAFPVRKPFSGPRRGLRGISSCSKPSTPFLAPWARDQGQPGQDHGHISICLP